MNGQRRGFTLVELLVVIMIIGVLVSLLLPAVQAAREAARRIQCNNNLKQLGLAVLNYEQTFRLLPPSGIIQKRYPHNISDGEFDPQGGKQFSWIVLILPQIEQAPLHDKFDFRVDVFSQPSEPQEVQLETLLCPSDSSPGKVFVHPGLTRGKRFGKGNYAAYVSPFHTDLQIRFPGALGGDGQRLAVITDGTTNTIMLSEVRTRNNERDQRGAWALPWTASSNLSFDVHHAGDYYDQSQFRVDSASPSYAGRQPPNNMEVNFDMLYDCVNPSEARQQRMPCGTFGGGAMHYLSAAPRSGHVGGVLSVFCDGSTHFVPNDIDPVAFAYIISINDNQPLNAAQYVR